MFYQLSAFCSLLSLLEWWRLGSCCCCNSRCRCPGFRRVDKTEDLGWWTKAAACGLYVFLTWWGLITNVVFFLCEIPTLETLGSFCQVRAQIPSLSCSSSPRGGPWSVQEELQDLYLWNQREKGVSFPLGWAFRQFCCGPGAMDCGVSPHSIRTEDLKTHNFHEISKSRHF